MQKHIFLISAVAALCWLCYAYGKTKAKTEIIEKQVEVIRYETKEVCKIMARPNLDDDHIVKLFRTGRL